MDNVSQQVPIAQPQNPPLSNPPVQSPNHFQRNFLIFFTIAIIVALLGAGVYLLANQNKQASTVQTSPTPTLNPTANWKTYDSSYGFSIKYPPELSIDTSYPGYVFIGKQISVKVESNPPQSCRGDCPLDRITTTEPNIKIGTVTWTKISGVRESSEIAGYTPPQAYVEYIAFQENYVYTIKINELDRDIALLPNYEEKYPRNRPTEISQEKLKMFNQIVSTLKFTDQNTGSSGSTLCIQVITPAKNNTTNECREFPTPCDVPQGWTKVSSCSY